MRRETIMTNDGSATISIPELQVTYHSHFGAIQESMHVFVNAGFRYLAERSSAEPLTIFEMGFGTGLNALLTLHAAGDIQRRVRYLAVEAFPLTSSETAALNYGQVLNRPQVTGDLIRLHAADWGRDVPVSPFFMLHKMRVSLLDMAALPECNLIYFDAFAPAAQPELWTTGIFQRLFAALLPEGLLVTYCSKGSVRRAMEAAGFLVTKLPGPPGKREIVRAFRPG